MPQLFISQRGLLFGEAEDFCHKNGRGRMASFLRQSVKVAHMSNLRKTLRKCRDNINNGIFRIGLQFRFGVGWWSDGLPYDECRYFRFHYNISGPSSSSSCQEVFCAVNEKGLVSDGSRRFMEPVELQPCHYFTEACGFKAETICEYLPEGKKAFLDARKFKDGSVQIPEANDKIHLAVVEAIFILILIVGILLARMLIKRRVNYIMELDQVNLARIEVGMRKRWRRKRDRFFKAQE